MGQPTGREIAPDSLDPDKMLMTKLVAVFVLVGGVAALSDNGVVFRDSDIDKLLVDVPAKSKARLALLDRFAEDAREARKKGQKPYMDVWLKFIERGGLVVGITTLGEIEAAASSGTPFPRLRKGGVSILSVDLGAVSIEEKSGKLPLRWIQEDHGEVGISHLAQFHWILELTFEQESGLLRDWLLKFAQGQ